MNRDLAREETQAPFNRYALPFNLSNGRAHAAMAPILWDAVMNGMQDADFYGSDGTAYAVVGRWIVWSTDQGFVHCTRFPSAADAAEYAHAEEANA